MSQEAIRSKVVALIEQVAERTLDGVQHSDQLELDSIKRITLIVELENEFGLTLGEDLDPDTFDTIDAITRFIAESVQ